MKDIIPDINSFCNQIPAMMLLLDHNVIIKCWWQIKDVLSHNRKQLFLDSIVILTIYFKTTSTAWAILLQRVRAELQQVAQSSECQVFWENGCLCRSLALMEASKAAIFSHPLALLSLCEAEEGGGPTDGLWGLSIWMGSSAWLQQTHLSFQSLLLSYFLHTWLGDRFYFMQV